MNFFAWIFGKKKPVTPPRTGNSPCGHDQIHKEYEAMGGQCPACAVVAMDKRRR